MFNIKLQYGRYMKEKCCEDCDYAGEYRFDQIAGAIPIEICPDCGGQLVTTVGRWMYTETPASWWETFGTGKRTKTVYHGFERGRE